MNSVGVFASKELLDLRRNKVVWVLTASLAAAVLISVVVASLDFRTQIADYHAYVSQLKASGSTVIPAAPQLFPLQLLRGGFEYIEIIGALFAVVVGYGTIARERSRGTMHLIFTRDIGRASFASGKLIGIGAFWAVMVSGIIAVAAASVAVVGTASLNGGDAFKLLIAGVASWVYLMFWSAIAAGLTALMRRTTSALILALGLWLLVVLIVPQIGDTMDPDNQVPGGLFKALAIQKPDEVAVLAHFASYESARNALEATSVSKLFERIAFAFLGIKDKYNQQGFGPLWHAMYRYSWSTLAMTVSATGFAIATSTRNNLLRKAS